MVFFTNKHTLTSVLFFALPFFSYRVARAWNSLKVEEGRLGVAGSVHTERGSHQHIRTNVAARGYLLFPM